MANEQKGEALVETIFARIDGEGEDATLMAYTTEHAGIDTDDSVKIGDVVEVGIYKLERIKKVRKIVEEI